MRQARQYRVKGEKIARDERKYLSSSQISNPNGQTCSAGIRVEIEPALKWAAAGKKRRSPPAWKMSGRPRPLQGRQNGKRIGRRLAAHSGPPAQAAADSAPEGMAPRYAPQQARPSAPMWHHDEGKGLRETGSGGRPPERPCP